MPVQPSCPTSGLVVRGSLQRRRGPTLLHAWCWCRSVDSRAPQMPPLMHALPKAVLQRLRKRGTAQLLPEAGPAGSQQLSRSFKSGCGRDSLKCFPVQCALNQKGSHRNGELKFTPAEAGLRSPGFVCKWTGLLDYQGKLVKVIC